MFFENLENEQTEATKLTTLLIDILKRKRKLMRLDFQFEDWKKEFEILLGKKDFSKIQKMMIWWAKTVGKKGSLKLFSAHSFCTRFDELESLYFVRERPFDLDISEYPIHIQSAITEHPQRFSDMYYFANEIMLKTSIINYLTFIHKLRKGMDLKNNTERIIYEDLNFPNRFAEYYLRWLEKKIQKWKSWNGDTNFLIFDVNTWTFDFISEIGVQISMARTCKPDKWYILLDKAKNSK